MYHNPHTVHIALELYIRVSYITVDTYYSYGHALVDDALNTYNFWRAGRVCVTAHPIRIRSICLWARAPTPFSPTDVHIQLGWLWWQWHVYYLVWYACISFNHSFSSVVIVNLTEYGNNILYLEYVFPNLIFFCLDRRRSDHVILFWLIIMHNKRLSCYVKSDLTVKWGFCLTKMYRMLSMCQCWIDVKRPDVPECLVNFHERVLSSKLLVIFRVRFVAGPCKWLSWPCYAYILI